MLQEPYPPPHILLPLLTGAMVEKYLNKGLMAKLLGLGRAEDLALLYHQSLKASFFTA
jgi:hypothetical protein